MEAKQGAVGRAALGLSNIIENNVKGKKGLNEGSPSKVMEEIGKYAAEGLAIGLDSTRMLDKAINNMTAPLVGLDTVQGNTTTNSLTYGDIVVNVSGAGVQNEELLARKISDNIFRQVRAQKAVWA